MEKKNKRKIILLSVLAIVILTVGIVAIIQRNNIKAAQYYLSLSQDEIDAKIKENDEKVASVFNEKLPVKVRDLTDEEKRMVVSEVITVEEAVDLLVGKSKAETVTAPSSQTTSATTTGKVTTASSTTSVESSTTSVATSEAVVESADDNQVPTAEEEANAELAELVAEAYVLRARYTGMLDGMRASAIADFKALSAEEQTDSNKMEIGLRYVNRAGAMEAQCDGQMDSLVARIESVLSRNGGDKSVIGDIKATYAEEKSLKKAYYMSMYS